MAASRCASRACSTTASCEVGATPRPALHPRHPPHTGAVTVALDSPWRHLPTVTGAPGESMGDGRDGGLSAQHNTAAGAVARRLRLRLEVDRSVGFAPGGAQLGPLSGDVSHKDLVYIARVYNHAAMDGQADRLTQACTHPIRNALESGGAERVSGALVRRPAPPARDNNLSMHRSTCTSRSRRLLVGLLAAH